MRCRARGRGRLQPGRHSRPKLLFGAGRTRPRAARACPVLAESRQRRRKEVEGTSEESAFGPPLHDELTFLRKRFVSGHGFSRAATVFQSCHSQPSAATLAARACPERSEGTREESAFGPPVHYEPIFLHREIRIRARLQPCRHSPPKLSFRAVRNRACAARACPERTEGTREESPFGPPVHL